MARILFQIALALAMVFSPATAEAARVSPMIVELEPTGRASVARVELTNDSERNIPFEVRMMLGEISEEGELTLSPAEENFLVFPAQAIVESKSQQVFRIQYVGEPELAKSEIYYMSIQQIPVEIEAEASQVQVVINYNVLVNVVPDGVSPVATIRSIEARVEEEKSGIQVRLANDGTGYFMAGLSDWSITGTTQNGETYSENYKGDEMTRKIGVGVIGPGRVRSFFIPLDEELAPDSIKIKVEP